MSTPERPGSRTGPISFYLPELTVGGAQRVTVDLVNGLAARGHDVELVCSYPGGELRGQVDSSVTLVDFDTRVVPGVGVLASVPALARYLRRREPRVLFSVMTYASVVALAASEVARTETPVVPVEHSTFGMSRGGTRDVTARLASVLYARADRVVAVSEGVAESVRAGTNVDPADVAVLYNLVPVEAVRERAAAPLDHPFFAADLDPILWVGRLEPEKDLDTLLRAFERVHARRPTARLVLAGTGSRREALETLAAERGLADAVSFTGFVDPAPYMARASAFALSSRYEGLPTVLIEALACGCPVVSTDCPSGPREILGDDAYGRLVPVGDDAAFADALLDALDDPADGERLRARADEFAPDRVLDAYEAFVDGLTN
ncbi:glycosyltransferase [Halocalculus aciditolerans]|uniref:Glycosyl transferase n=1 Tax=Halocalculus aciditolerans TaxID=1383812 RepID=A0A830F587_9EURY|nr:glycosyltransferase [Halocalculus aciditolerans]GGL55911.1 glycosyl transferase [Halocalculus aciditolerans]